MIYMVLSGKYSEKVTVLPFFLQDHCLHLWYVKVVQSKCEKVVHSGRRKKLCLQKCMCSVVGEWLLGNVTGALPEKLLELHARIYQKRTNSCSPRMFTDKLQPKTLELEAVV